MMYTHLKRQVQGRKPGRGSVHCTDQLVVTSTTIMVNCLVLRAAVTGRVVYHPPPPFIQTESCSYMEGAYAVQCLPLLVLEV